VLLHSADGVPQLIAGALGTLASGATTSLATDDSALRAAMGPLLEAFRLEAKDLVLRKVRTDELGARHYRYLQKLDGLDVVGGDLVIHVDRNGTIVAANGTARGGIPRSPGTAAISESAASLSIANDARWASITDRRVTDSRLVYFLAQDGSMHKAYEQIVEGTRGQDPVKDKVFVDVENGLVVGVAPMIHFAKNRMTYSANNGTELPGQLRRTEGQGPTGDTAVDGAHDGAGDTYDGYQHFFNRDSFDNAGATMTSNVHFSTDYCNAFWNSSQMVYGDGNGTTCTNLTAIDVVAHEMTHAVTEHESNLIYQGESGGLNESLSDIGGAFIESYVRGGRNGALSLDARVFLIGDATMPPFLRNMCDPAADGASADVWDPGIDGIDVHYSSGPNNLAFCLLVKGGAHPRGKTSVMVPAIGMEKAVRLMYKANVDNLTSQSNYSHMRNAVMLAAQQLGYDQSTRNAIGCAYAAIGVGNGPSGCPAVDAND
jgi:vibriolysin